VESFENEFCEFIGLPYGHAVCVSSGTAALYLSLWSLNAQNKKIAFPVYTCSSLRHAVAMVGGIEVLIDVKEGTPNMDLDTLKRSEADIAIIPHMFGFPNDLSGIVGIDVIEDCAQALGAKVNGMYVGLHGRIGIYSFYATKLITTGGQGGMVISKDKSLIDSIRDYREFDCRKDANKRFNFQMTDLQGAIGRIQLRKLPGFLQRRHEIFGAYLNAGLPLMDIVNENSHPIRYRAVLITKYPQQIIKSLLNNKIKSIIPIEDWELLDKSELFPNALNLTKCTVSLPIYPLLSDYEVNKIISTVLN